jgi:hypothetical protein
MCAHPSSFAAFISFAHCTTKSLSTVSSRERTLPSLLECFSEPEMVSSLVIGRCAGASDCDLMVAPALSMVQDSMKEVMTVKEK